MWFPPAPLFNLPPTLIQGVGDWIIELLGNHCQNPPSSLNFVPV
jgi:hypothetical protein